MVEELLDLGQPAGVVSEASVDQVQHVGEVDRIGRGLLLLEQLPDDERLLVHLMSTLVVDLGPLVDFLGVVDTESYTACTVELDAIPEIEGIDVELPPRDDLLQQLDLVVVVQRGDLESQAESHRVAADHGEGERVDGRQTRSEIRL
jgi:hypothetical protein